MPLFQTDRQKRQIASRPLPFAIGVLILAIISSFPVWILVALAL
jgi:hypothetical protein